MLDTVCIELVGSTPSAVMLKGALEQHGLEVQLQVSEPRTIVSTGSFQTLRFTFEATGDLLALLSGVRLAIQRTRERSPGVGIRIIGHHDAPPEGEANIEASSQQRRATVEQPGPSCGSWA
jgi:hypothetical protein